jgi:cold shock CspA family protein
MEATADVQDAVRKHVAELETRWGRVTACRITVKGPGGRHRKGGLYEVRIHLALPDGREVNVDHTAPEDGRRADLTFAVNNAFKRARRQLQDEVRRTQGQIKHHEPQPIGTVVRLDPEGVFGFLEASDGQEVYFHRNSVVEGSFAQLRVGSRVAYVQEPGEKGAQASTVRPVGKHGLRV